MADSGPAARLPAPDIVTVIIDGKTHQFPKGTVLLEACNAVGRQRPVLLLPPRAVVAGGLPAVPGRRQGTAEAGAVLLHAGRRQDGGDDQVAARAGRPPPDAGVHARQPPHRLPDLRQGGRVPAAEALLRLGRQVRAQRRHQGQEGQGRRPRPDTSSSIRSAASSARAASASATRWRRPTSSRWPSAATTRCSPRRPATSSTTPTRSTPSTSARWARSPRRTSASRCAPGSCTRRRRSARAARPAATSRSTTRAARSTASSRAPTPPSTSTGCATRGASPTSACTTERLAAPLSGGAAGRVGPRARRRGTRAARGARRVARPSVGVVFNAQSTNEDLYALARLAFDHLGAQQGLPRRPRPGLERRHPRLAPTRTRTPPARSRSARAACARCSISPTTSRPARSPRCSSSARDGVLGKDAAPGALPLDRLETLVVLGTHRTRSPPPRKVALPLAGLGRGGRHVHQPARHGAAACAPPSRPRATRCPAGRSSRTSRASSAPRWTSPSAKAVFVEAKQKLPFMKDADWGRPMLPVQLRFANSRG